MNERLSGADRSWPVGTMPKNEQIGGSFKFNVGYMPYFDG